MKDQDIINQLASLREVKPREDWKNSNRDFLLSQIRNDSKEYYKKEKKSIFSMYSSALFGHFRQTAMQPAVLMLLMFGVILGSSLTVNAAFYSLPGSHLYKVKLGLEQTQLAFVRDDIKQTEFKLELAKKRVDEIEKIVSRPGASEKKLKKVNIAIDQFNKEVDRVQDSVDNLGTDLKGKASEKAFQIAISVDNATTKISKSLHDQIRSLPKDVQGTAKAAVRGVDSVGDSALKKISLGIKQDEVTDDTGVQQEESGEIVEDLTESLSTKLELVEKNLAKLIEEKETIEITDENTADLDALGIILKDADSLVSDSQARIDEKNVEGTLETITLAKEKINEAETIFSKLLGKDVDEKAALNENDNNGDLEGSKDTEVSENDQKIEKIDEEDVDVEVAITVE